MKGRTDLKVEPLDITYLEKAWDEYLIADVNATADTLAMFMGKSMGRVLREIRILRTQVEGLQAALGEERQMYARA